MTDTAGKFRALQPGDLEFLADNLREADKQELRALLGDDVVFFEVLSTAVMRSSHLWVGALENDQPVSIFGAAPISMLTGEASPWFLSTDEAYRYPRTLMLEGRRYLSRMLEAYEYLYNYVDARNDRSIRWLKRMGFQLHEATPQGVAEMPFHKFDIRGA